MHEPILFLTPEHLNQNARSIYITELSIWDFKNNIISLNSTLNAEIILFQDTQGSVRIFKNKNGVRGTILSNKLLNLEGWALDNNENAFRKYGETITIKDAGGYHLQLNPNTQPILQIPSLFLIQEGHAEPIKRVSTVEDLRYFFSPDDFIIQDNVLN